MNFFFIVLKLLIYAWHLVLVVQLIKNYDLRPLVHFFLKTSLSELWVNVLKFGHKVLKKNLKVQDKPADE